MNFSKIALAGALLALASPIAALAQSSTQNNAAIETAALNSLTQNDRAQVQNILGLLQTNQIDTGTAAVQIDAVLSDSEVKAVLDEAKKASFDAQDAGLFLAKLAQPPSSK